MNLVKNFPPNIWLRKSASKQPRMSLLKFVQFSGDGLPFSPNLSRLFGAHGLCIAQQLLQVTNLILFYAYVQSAINRLTINCETAWLFFLDDNEGTFGGRCKDVSITRAWYSKVGPTSEYRLRALLGRFRVRAKSDGAKMLVTATRS